jgi:tryptophan synthase alpha chain
VLESYIKNRLKEKEILLMTHIVMGYPSLQDSYNIAKEMVNAGVDIMELQIPFSEPTADGPVIVRANQSALDSGTKVHDCLEMAGKIATDFDIPFLIMTYYNIFYKYGVGSFTSAMAEHNLKGAIVPDLPPEEGREYLDEMKKNSLSPILIFSPTTSRERMTHLASLGDGFIYCVARKGVTGQSTSFSEDLSSYLSRCKKATSLPLALGFGIKEKKDIDFLKGKVDIAVIGSQTIRIVEQAGVKAVGGFIRSLQ